MRSATAALQALHAAWPVQITYCEAAADKCRKFLLHLAGSSDMFAARQQDNMLEEDAGRLHACIQQMTPRRTLAVAQ